MHISVAKNFFVFLGVLIAACAGTVAASAQTWAKADYVDGRLISATDGTGGRNDLLIAIDLRLKPKWKTYWRTPGDAGLPPEADWAQSENISDAKLIYPAPIRFQLFGLQTFGYANRVTFPVRVKLKDSEKPAALRAKLNVLVCSDVCVPQVLNLALDVPASAATPSAYSHLIQRALASVPPQGALAPVNVKNVAYISYNGAPALSAEIKSSEPLRNLDIIPEVEPFAAFEPSLITLSADQRSARAVFKLAQPLPPGETLAGRPITMTVTAQDTLGEIATTIAEGGAASADHSWSWAAMIGAALLGGLILNLMPCVLPVLSVKLLSLLEAREKKKREVRLSFLATAAGIVVSLLALAAGLIALKAAGQAVGWGIQFQQPLFIAAMALLVTVFACNLWGFFEVTLPSWLSNWAGGDGSQDQSYLAHFLTGIFVTILATPCSAPFVGTAVGFGLASGTTATLFIFAALGLGLALPYLAVALRPGWVHALPRPGAWMNTLRVVLGLALLATAFWLITVLATQVGWPLAGLTAIGLAGLVTVLAYRDCLVRFLTRGGIAAVATALALGTMAVPVVLPSTLSPTATVQSGPVDWQPFEDREIRSLIAQGKTVFVDVTADWCITCKANKRLVIYQDAVAERLRGEVVAMQADWTTPDPEITAFLARFGRYGIPMNVVFGPGNPQGIVLPEILTQDLVLRALEQAATRKAAALRPPNSH